MQTGLPASRGTAPTARQAVISGHASESTKQDQNGCGVMPDHADPGKLDQSCRVLFGKRWKAPLARFLGVQRETVSRWAGGAKDTPLYARRAVSLLMQTRGTVLSLCDRTGNMVRPWAEAGFECICVDLQHEGVRCESGITFIGADLLNWLPPPRRYAIVFAFPPCTNVAVSGARWFREKGLGGLSEAVDLLEACRRICEWSEAPWMIENPVSTFSSYWREPDHTFDPCDYGGYLTPADDAYTKKTCLWTGNGFVMPRRKPVDPVEGSRMHLLPPSSDRANLRSETPMGFALATFESNAQLLT